jgi:hypothetical protein
MSYAERVMPLIPTDLVNQSQIKAAIEAVEQQLAPHVVRIRYDIGQDWSGQWALYFRILFTDEAVKRKNLQELAPKVVRQISDRLDWTSGLFPYFHFRSESEQRQRNEPAW